MPIHLRLWKRCGDRSQGKMAHSPEFLNTKLERSRIADLFCSSSKGRAVRCDGSDLRVRINKSWRHLDYEKLRSADVSEGRIWGTLRLTDFNGNVHLVSGLPKGHVVSLLSVIQKNLTLARERLAARFAPQIASLAAEVSRFDEGTRYIPQYLVRSLLTRFEELPPLPALLDADSAAADPTAQKLLRIKTFVSDHTNRVRSLNRAFVKAELAAMRSFFDTVEKSPLTQCQAEAVLADEDRNLVVAAAGSGKTSVIVAKAAYLIRKNLCQPSDILMVAFGGDAVKEMEVRLEQRIGLPIKVSTFDALGYSIVRQVDGKAPSLAPLAKDDKSLVLFIRQQVLELLESDPTFARKFGEWFQSYFVPYKSLWSFSSLDEYYSYLREFELRTLKGELVKSLEECEIANWLYLNGIEYEYERPYERNTATALKRQYRPDFYLPQLAIYIEHFGVDKAGRPPPFINDETYRAGMEWKRRIHKECGTKLVETYSYEKANGTLLTGLHAKIEAVAAAPPVIDPQSIAEAFLRLADDSRIDGFSRLTAAFLRHLKGGQKTVATLRKHLANAADRERALAYLNVFEPIFNAYEAHLMDTGTIDFEGMIARATEYTEARRFQSSYRYILVDEFQDVGVGRSKLLNALLHQKYDGQLFAVGDDWQSIFRFAGSDISLMTNFPEHFGATAQTFLEDTFRCNESIAKVASSFVLRNPAQIKKAVKAARPSTTGPAVFVLRENPETPADVLLDCLGRIAKSKVGVGVMLIGRYRHEKPENLNELRASFPSLRLTYRTAHGSKGLEDDYVVVLGLRSGRMGFPSQIVDDPILDVVLAAPETFPHSEERRLMYVAMTRARHAVYLLTPKNAPSSFLTEIEADLGNGSSGDADDEKAACPICKGGHLQLRKASTKTFVGCSNYPYCDHTERACPKCGQGVLRRGSLGQLCDNAACAHEVQNCPRCATGWLTERKRKDGSGSFLGCSNYPDCRYTRNVSGESRERRQRRLAGLN
jgi:DNA helicase IV